MKFKEIAFFQIILEVILFMVLWTFLFLGFGVKSVLFSQLIRAFISSSVLIALSYKTEFRISFKIDLGSLKYFISFGKFVFGRDAISFATKYFDELLVGFFMEPEVLGYYHFSKNIIQKISKLIKESFGNIFYSFITKINDIKSVSKEYFRVLNILYSISFPLFAGIIITIQLFIPIILGEEWIATIYYFRLFSLIAMFHVLSLGTASNLLDSLGKPDIPFKIRLISDVIYLTSLVVLAPLGINYVLGCYGLYIALKSFLLQKYAFKALGKKLLFLFPQTKKPLLSVGLMVFSVLIFQKLFIGFFPPIIILVFSMVIGILIYFISNWNLVKNGWKIMVNR